MGSESSQGSRTPNIHARRRPVDIFDILDGFFQGDILPENTRRVGKSGVIDFVPALDISETTEEVLVRAELPGMAREDFEVRWSDRGLVIHGEKKQEKTSSDNDRCHIVERRYGSFERTIPLDPDRIDEDKLSAEFSNGILTVRIGKSQKSKGKEKKIEVH